MARITDILVRDTDSDGTPTNPRRFHLIADEGNGGWPSMWLRDAPPADHPADEGYDDDEYEPLDLAAVLASHLTDGEVAVLIETGGEGTRYLLGLAVAVNNTGATRHVDLNAIYGLAEDLGADISRAEY